MLMPTRLTSIWPEPCRSPNPKPTPFRSSKTMAVSADGYPASTAGHSAWFVPCRCSMLVSSSSPATASMAPFRNSPLSTPTKPSVYLKVKVFPFQAPCLLKARSGACALTDALKGLSRQCAPRRARKSVCRPAELVTLSKTGAIYPNRIPLSTGKNDILYFFTVCPLCLSQRES